MTISKILICASFSPEMAGLICMLFKKGRAWWGRLIEDSDGDPHHTDGIFLVILYAAVWCFHLAIIASIEHIFNGRELLDIIITFLTAGCTLTGVRVAFKNKLNTQTGVEK